MIYLLYIKNYVKPDNIFEVIEDHVGNVYSFYNSEKHTRTWLSNTLTIKKPSYEDLYTLDQAILHLKVQCSPGLDIGYVNLTEDYPELLI